MNDNPTKCAMCGRKIRKDERRTVDGSYIVCPKCIHSARYRGAVDEVKWLEGGR